ncbi:MAG: hypothetical protein KIT80_09625 [Chitinophagaceae bacterium]|nr:hypothetical protein [Chitinophagaceae bacterium]MCW5927158.1 hypothetical protein [Chitinophagaceae bacterium]
MYYKVPLQKFMADMMRWYGLQVKNPECAPPVLISAQLCYREPVEKMLSVLRQHGVPTYRKDNTLTLCDPALRIRSGTAALQQTSIIPEK